MMIKICPKCQNEHAKSGIFCSRSCANSRGPRSNDFKNKVSKKLKGVKPSAESTRKSILARGLVPIQDRPNTICIVCGLDTGTKKRMTCSKDCYRELARQQSQSNPNCGGQKHTHRQIVSNNEGQTFTVESSF